MTLKLVDRNPQGTGRIKKSGIVASEWGRLPMLPEESDRGQMEGIEGPDWVGERLQGPCEYRRREFNKGNATQEGTHLICVGSGKLACVNPSPELILDQAAGDQRLLPKARRRQAVFRQKMGERNRSVKIDHRSLRSCSSSRSRSRNNITGLRGGGPEALRTGGVIQPWRTASASKASARSGLRLFSGGTSSATTRSRSVTSTVSPCAARRTYSLSLFLRTFNPTALMGSNVASGSYHVKDRCDLRFWIEGKT